MARHHRAPAEKKQESSGKSTEEPEGVRIRLLRGLRVSVGDRIIEENARRLRKAAGLVKLLALAEGHTLHRERAMDLLWPDLGPIRPRTTCGHKGAEPAAAQGPVGRVHPAAATLMRTSPGPGSDRETSSASITSGDP
jgi:hypothetical protein